MTRFYKSLWFVILAIIVFSCSDDEDPLPVPTVDFRVGAQEVEVGIPVMFDNLTTNAARYEWDFGDGSDPITDISPSITFTTPGMVTVTLRAFTQDEQVDSVSRDVVVKQRILTRLTINNFPELNGDVGWDPEEVTVDSMADVILQLFPLDSPEPDEIVITQLVDNATAPFGFNVNPDAARFVLTDETWVMILDDFDGTDLNTATQEDFERIAVLEFNPVQGPTIRTIDGSGGFVSIIAVGPTLGLLDIDLVFELE